MPPNFDDLPSPENENRETNLKQNEIKNLISKNKNITEEINENLEGSILKKIKNN